MCYRETGLPYYYLSLQLLANKSKKRANYPFYPLSFRNFTRQKYPLSLSLSPIELVRFFQLFISNSIFRIVDRTRPRLQLIARRWWFDRAASKQSCEMFGTADEIYRVRRIGNFWKIDRYHRGKSARKTLGVSYNNRWVADWNILLPPIWPSGSFPVYANLHSLKRCLRKFPRAGNVD